MSFMIETVLAEKAAQTLIDSFVRLRESRKKEELETPEWQELEKAYIEHLKWRFAYPKQVFGQQLFANWLITALVIALVVCGLVFSFMQLKYALLAGDLSSLKSEVQIQTAGRVSISSSIVGAITLVISLLFFFLYLKYVFEIRHPVPPHVTLPDGDVQRLLQKDQNLGGKAEIDLKDIRITKIENG